MRFEEPLIICERIREATIMRVGVHHLLSGNHHLKQGCRKSDGPFYEPHPSASPTPSPTEKAFNAV